MKYLNIFSENGYMKSNFWNIFNTENRNVICNVIYYIHEVAISNSEYSFCKDELIEHITNYLSFNHLALVSEDGSQDYNYSKNSNIIFNKLKTYGWIRVESDSRWVKNVDFTKPAIDFMRSLDLHFDNNNSDFAIHLQSIYDTLKKLVHKRFNINEHDYVSYFELYKLLLKSDKEFIEFISQISLTTKEHIFESYDADDLPKTISLLNKFMMDVINGSYLNLKTKDVPVFFAREILELINTIIGEPDYFDENIILNSIAQEIMEQNSAVSEYETKIEIINNLQKIENQFSNIDDTLNRMDEQANTCITSLQNRISLLTSNGSIVSFINNILVNFDRLQERDIKFLGDSIDITMNDGCDIYVPIKRKEKIKKTKLKCSIITDEMKQKAKDSIQEDLKFSKENVEKHITSYIENKGTYSSENINLSNNDELICFIQAMIYSDFPYIKMSYDNSVKVQNGDISTIKVEMGYK